MASLWRGNVLKLKLLVNFLSNHCTDDHMIAEEFMDNGRYKLIVGVRSTYVRHNIKEVKHLTTANEFWRAFQLGP